MASVTQTFIKFPCLCINSSSSLGCFYAARSEGRPCCHNVHREGFVFTAYADIWPPFYSLLRDTALLNPCESDHFRHSCSSQVWYKRQKNPLFTHTENFGLFLLMVLVLQTRLEILHWDFPWSAIRAIVRVQKNVVDVSRGSFFAQIASCRALRKLLRERLTRSSSVAQCQPGLLCCRVITRLGPPAVHAVREVSLAPIVEVESFPFVVQEEAAAASLECGSVWLVSVILSTCLCVCVCVFIGINLSVFVFLQCIKP